VTHYGRPDLRERVHAALREAGHDLDDLSRDDVAALTEFHVGGRAATRRLAREAGLEAADDPLVVDVGCGLGGPSRTLAAEFGARALGVDRTRSYLVVASDLTARLGLADRVDFSRAEAGALPVRDGAADAVWLQHVLPNVTDLAELLAEARRALAPDGRLAVHELCAGDGTPDYPLPFAARAADAQLRSPGDLRDTAAAAGFEPVAWTDATDEALAWYEALTPPPVGLGVVVGDAFREQARNARQALADGRLRAVRGVLAPA